MKNDTNNSASREAKSSDLGGQIIQVLMNFMPGPIKQMFEKGLLKAFLIVVFAVVILPPLSALLAAFWLEVKSQLTCKSVRR